MMKYLDGTIVRVGDRVRLASGDTAVVVASFDTDEYSNEYPRSEWKESGDGILLSTDLGALVQFDDSLRNEIEKLY